MHTSFFLFVEIEIKKIMKQKRNLFKKTIEENLECPKWRF